MRLTKYENMKYYLNALSAASLIILFTLSSCKKDASTINEDPAKTATEYLTAGNWKVTGITANPGINTGTEVITDFFSYMMEACDKDDLIRFNANGTITEDEGALKCDPENPQSVTEGSWVLGENDTTLSLSFPDEDAVVMTIVSLNATTLIISYQIIEDFGTGSTTQTLTASLSLQ